MGAKRSQAKPSQAEQPGTAGDLVDATRPTTVVARLAARLHTLKGAIVAIAGVGAVLGGLAGYWNAYQAARGTTESSQLLALVGKGDAGPLSIVVLPLVNHTGDPQQAYVADGLTAALTTDLSRIRDAFIVSVATAFAYKDKPVTVQQIGKELGVRFALQGSVQRSGDKIRINAQLADTSTNAQLWSESFDGSQSDLFALQEMVTARVGSSIGREMVIIAARESDRRLGEPRVVDILLRARAAALRPESKANYEETQSLFRQVLAADPKNAQALAGLAISLSTEAYNGWIEDPASHQKQYVEARELAIRAKEIDPSNSLPYIVLSDFAIEHGDYVEGVRLAHIALSLDPKNPARYNNMATAFMDAGDAASAIAVLVKGIRLSDRYRQEYLYGLMALAHFMLGDDPAAIEWAKKALDANPKYIPAGAVLAMAYAHKGDLTRARATAEELLRTDPTLTFNKGFHRKAERSPRDTANTWRPKRCRHGVRPACPIR